MAASFTDYIATRTVFHGAAEENLLQGASANASDGCEHSYPSTDAVCALDDIAFAWVGAAPVSAAYTWRVAHISRHRRPGLLRAFCGSITELALAAARYDAQTIRTRHWLQTETGPLSRAAPTLARVVSSRPVCLTLSIARTGGAGVVLVKRARTQRVLYMARALSIASLTDLKSVGLEMRTPLTNMVGVPETATCSPSFKSRSTAAA